MSSFLYANYDSDEKQSADPDKPDFVRTVTNANGSVSLVGSDGNYYGVTRTVPEATGIAATDTANINAVFAEVGNGGIVEFPENQTYAIKNYVGGLIIPGKIIGNGSTLIAENQPYTNLNVGQSITTGSNISFTVADATQLSNAPFIVASNGAGSYTAPMTVSSIVGNTVTVSSASVIGTLSGTGVTVTPITNLMLFQITDAEQISLEVTGFVFDGNATNRTRNRQWSNDELLKIVGSTSIDTKIWIHNNIFKNAPCEGIAAADCTYLDVSNNHFENIIGSGVHPGGSGVDDHKDFVCTNNTFFNVYQLTGATSPTGTNYGHLTSMGAMCTSNGPGRATWQGNIVDTSTGYGLFAATNQYTHDYTINGNVFYNCTKGGFRCSGTGERLTISGNEVYNCGHDSVDISGLTVETTAISGTAKKATISGNTFVDSQLWLGLDAGDISVSGNYFSGLNKQAGTNELALLSMAYSSSENQNIAITGNVFRLPKNSTESAVVSNLPWNCINLSRATGVNIFGNVFTGGRHGINFMSSVYKGVSISGNVFHDQYNSGGVNAHCINAGATTTLHGMNVTGNQFYLSGAASTPWIAVEFGTATSCIGNMISNNNISAPTANTGSTGISIGSNTTGFMITNNQIYLGYGASAIAAISAASAGASVVITNNAIRNSSPVNYGSATVAAGNQAV